MRIPLLYHPHTKVTRKRRCFVAPPPKFLCQRNYDPPSKKCETTDEDLVSKNRRKEWLWLWLHNGGTKWWSWEEKSRVCRQIKQVSQLWLRCFVMRRYVRLWSVIQRCFIRFLGRILRRKPGKWPHLRWRLPMKDRIVSVLKPAWTADLVKILYRGCLAAQ
jgi:hypothetical protein